MSRVQLPIAGGAYKSESLPISNQQCVNWYPNMPQTQGALSNGTLLGSPGIANLKSTGISSQVNRGSHVKSGIPYFVNGNAIYRLDRVVANDGTENFNIVSLGDIEGTGRVSMSDNGTQLMVLVPGGKGYIINEDALPVYQEITDGDFDANGNPQHVVFINSFFIVTTDTKKFIRSAANDGLSWNALDSGTAEADPDPIVAPIVFKNQLFLAGSETFEVFEGVAAGGLGFQRINGFIINKGLFSPFSLIGVSDTFMFIGGGVNESPAVWAFSGSTVQKISTTAIDSELQNFTNEEIEVAFSYSYAQNGASFIGFNVGNSTFEFNTVSGLWNERMSQIITTKGVPVNTRWRANSMVTAYNRVLVGDSQDGRIGVVDPETYTEYGTEIIRTVTTQPFADQGNVLTVSSIELTVESGVGDFSTIDPVVRMSVSKDAKTFNNEISRSMGELGKYNQRCIWRKGVGRVSRFAVFKFVMSDPVKPVIIKLEAQMRGYLIGS